MSLRVISIGKVKRLRRAAGGKPSPNRANQSLGIDPKPVDLSMARMKVR